LKTPIHILGVFWGKNIGKWAVSEFLLLKECSNPKMTSYKANRVKIGSTV